MIQCKICERWFKGNLMSHLNSHHITCKEYSEKYNAPYCEDWWRKKQSDKTKETVDRTLVSEISKKLWNDPVYREKQKLKAKSKYTKEVKDHLSKVHKQNHTTGKEIAWAKGLTKETSEKIRSISIKTSKALSGRTKEDYQYLRDQSERMHNRPDEKKVYPSKFPKEKKDKWRQSISEGVSRAIQSGKFSCVGNHFQNGKVFFYNDDETVTETYVQSGLELNAICIFRQYGLPWKRCDKIIDYKWEDGTIHKYHPDFEIDFESDTFIIETKGYPDEYADTKIEYCKKLYPLTFICYSIDDIYSCVESITKLIRQKYNVNFYKRYEGKVKEYSAKTSSMLYSLSSTEPYCMEAAK